MEVVLKRRVSALQAAARLHSPVACVSHTRSIPVLETKMLVALRVHQHISHFMHIGYVAWWKIILEID